MEFLGLTLNYVVIYFGETYRMYLDTLILIHTDALQRPSGRPEHIRQYFILAPYYNTYIFMCLKKCRTS